MRKSFWNSLVIVGSRKICLYELKSLATLSGFLIVIIKVILSAPGAYVEDDNLKNIYLNSPNRI